MQTPNSDTIADVRKCLLTGVSGNEGDRRVCNPIGRTEPPGLPGTKPPNKEYTWRDPWLQLASMGGEALGPVKV